MEAFFADFRKILYLEILSERAKANICSRKRFHPSQRYFLAKLESEKYAGGGRPFCLTSNATITSLYLFSLTLSL